MHNQHQNNSYSPLMIQLPPIIPSKYHQLLGNASQYLCSHSYQECTGKCSESYPLQTSQHFRTTTNITTFPNQICGTSNKRRLDSTLYEPSNKRRKVAHHFSHNVNKPKEADALNARIHDRLIECIIKVSAEHMTAKQLRSEEANHQSPDYLESEDTFSEMISNELECVTVVDEIPLNRIFVHNTKDGCYLQENNSWHNNDIYIAQQNTYIESSDLNANVAESADNEFNLNSIINNHTTIDDDYLCNMSQFVHATAGVDDYCTSITNIFTKI